jgi:DNA-binding NtrC family response regulator
MSEKLRILVVEDNPADVDFIHEMLPQAGPLNFKIESVERLSKALIRLERKDVDLVLLDLGLPDSHGLTTFHKLRKAVPDVPVIVLTSTDDEKLAVTAVQNGAQDYLVKGQISGRPLVRAIRYALERQKAEEERSVLIQSLQNALADVKLLSGLLPICFSCKKIRDDKGYWNQVESYIQKHSEAEFFHSMCPDCFKKLSPNLKVGGSSDSSKKAP